jgi:hypothetical protein
MRRNAAFFFLFIAILCFALSPHALAAMTPSFDSASAEKDMNLLASGVADTGASGGGSRIEINQYINSYHGFTVLKPDKWTFKPGKFNDRIPIMLGSFDTGAYVTISVTKPTIAVTEDILDSNIKLTAQSSVSNFQRNDSGIKRIGGNNFYFIRGEGTERVTKLPCNLSVYGASVNKRVYLIVYIVPKANASQSESDFNSVLQGMRFI